MFPLLAVDPGVRKPAAALFSSAGVLQCAQRVRVPDAYHALPRGERDRQVAKLVVAWYRASVPPYGAPGWGTSAWPTPLLVIEYPQWYRASRSKGDPNDLGPLVGVGVGVGAILDAQIVAYLPAEWCKLPKSDTGDPWASPRGALIRGRLSEAERLCVQATHDAIDAVGLGLHHLGRLGRAFPGCV